MPRPDPASWLYPTPAGLYCEPGGFYIDPMGKADRALITHGHSDHARRGHGAVMATAETIDIMKVRLGERAAGSMQAIPCGETTEINGVRVRFEPAGHILGSAQIVLEWAGTRIVVSGDYKRRPDPTTPGFEPVGCDVFITEATFGLPIYRHEPAAAEIGKVLNSLQLFPERTHVIGAYSLGKCQRLIALLRAAGFGRPIYVPDGFLPLIALYERFGVPLGPVARLSEAAPNSLAGEIVLAPPGRLSDGLSAPMIAPLMIEASGWMRTEKRRRQGIELPLVISDHADWPELIQTIKETGAGEIWVTHGAPEALCHACQKMGLKARALSEIGRAGVEE